VPWEGEPRKLSKRNAFMKPGRVGWSLSPGSRRLMLRRRNHRHFLCKNSPALPPPVGCSFLRPDWPRSGRTFLRSLHSRLDPELQNRRSVPSYVVIASKRISSAPR
jgi:hypothetical protein